LLYDLLLNKGYQLIGLDLGKVRSTCAGHIDSVDIGKGREVNELIDHIKPEEIYYLAAFHQSSEDAKIDTDEIFEKSQAVNVAGLINFLEAIRRNSRKTRLFYAASSHVFGNDTASEFLDERSAICPDGIYGITKATGLFICRLYRRDHGIFASTGILFNHESSLRNEKFVSMKIVMGALSIKSGVGKKLILGDLNSEIDWGYAPDYVDAMFRIINHHSPDDFVVATGQVHSVRDFVDIAFDYAGLDYTLYVDENPGVVTKRAFRRVGNPRKLMELTGWKPSLTFRQMIRVIMDKKEQKNA